VLTPAFVDSGVPIVENVICISTFLDAGLQGSKQHVVQDWPPQALCDA